ncbi:MAG TPA: UPF0149 family protein [Halioglobus sp.]
MYDELPDAVGIFDFNEFADYLLDQGVLASPSQLHGCLSGLLCAGAPVQPEYGLDALIQALDLELHGELASRIMQLYVTTDAALREEDFTFYPLLPDDDEDITLQTAALASWCDGFLTGFAYRIPEEEKTGNVPRETGEVLQDIAAMAQAGIDDESEEDAEESFIELVEYLRVAVANIFMNNLATAEDRPFPSGNDRSVH